MTSFHPTSRNTIASIALCCMLCAGVSLSAAQDEKKGKDDAEKKKLPTIGEKTTGLERRDGLLTTFVDAERGKLWLEVPAAATPGGESARLLYTDALLTGLGSNPVGLDRGQLGRTHVVALRRVGGRVLVEAINFRYRALSENADEQRAVRQSFARSILWAGEVAAADPDGRVLVDFTSFIVRDAHGVVRTLKSSGQGSFKLEKDRSVLDAVNCLSFPDNIEFEALLTFSSSEPGRHVRETTPDPNSVTLVQHHSFVRLPDDGYKPRRFDTRVGLFGITFVDYAAPLDGPMDVRWIARHRLEKIDPTAERSRVKQPIVYYVDAGAPEPVRSALVEGASWWSKAFDVAGFIDAFRVEVMPEGAHPLDVRYNVIQWVHRSTRGWSYGGSVRDPRTGEIIKGHVSLGSLRVRQDRLLFEGLAGTDKTGSGDADDPVQLALARIRQLAAHEVGHTLGLSHNFAASTYAGRASVMDYPAPMIKLGPNDAFDFSEVYGVGVGAWDVHVINYGYRQFAPGTNENAALEAIVRGGLERGLRFISDADARPPGGAHPSAHLWDNGDDAVTALEHTLKVRQIALQRFGQRNIRPGRPLSLLHEVLTPLYLHHRYQLEAAIKVIGGLNYTYAVRGDGQSLAEPVDGPTQRRALQTVLTCLSPETLDLSEPVLALLAPRPFGYGGNRELFQSATSPAFDALGVAATAADLAVAGLLQPERCARLVDFHRRDSSLPSLELVLSTIKQTAFASGVPDDERSAELRRVVQRVVVSRLIGLSADSRAIGAVRGQVDLILTTLAGELKSRPARNPEDQAHALHLRQEIRRYLDRPHQSAPRAAESKPAPPGSPIGMHDPHADYCTFGGGL